MYIGVPIAVPAIVSLLPAGDEGAQGHLSGRLRSRVVAADDLGQAPIGDQRLAVGPQQDIGRLEIPMEHTAAVCIGDRLADVDETPQKLAEAARVGSAGSRSGLPISLV